MHKEIRCNRSSVGRRSILGALFAFCAFSGLGCPGGSGDGSATPAPTRNQFVYVTNEADNTVTEYSTNTDGTLQLIGSLPTGRLPGGIVSTSPANAISPAEAGMVFVLNRNDNTISQYVIQNAEFQHSSTPGLLTPTSTPTVATGKNPTAITFDPGTNLVYVTSQGDNTITAYSIKIGAGPVYSTSSTLVQMSKMATGGGPIDMSGGITVNGSDNSVSIFSEPGGASAGPLAPGTPNSLSSTSPSRVWATNFNLDTPFYVISSTANMIQAFNTRTTGSAFGYTTVSELSISTGRQPSAVDSNSGGFVFVTNFADNTISEYSSNLTPVAGTSDEDYILTPIATYGTGRGPYDLTEAFANNINYEYCLNRTDKTIEVFSMADGGHHEALTALSSVATGNSPARIAVFVGDQGFSPQSNGSITVPIRSAKKR